IIPDKNRKAISRYLFQVYGSEDQSLHPLAPSNRCSISCDILFTQCILTINRMDSLPESITYPRQKDPTYDDIVKNKKGGASATRGAAGAVDDRFGGGFKVFDTIVLFCILQLEGEAHSRSLPSLAINQKEMFYLYLFPGQISAKRKEVLFVVDISGSMKDRTIEATKSAVTAALSKLDDQGDSFSKRHNINAIEDGIQIYGSAAITKRYGTLFYGFSPEVPGGTTILG
ncbi:hypothetical protein M8C21_016637, partial [Ambrosia artemisiifolia]